MFTKSFLFLLLTLLAYTAIAQHSVTGKLKDAAFDFPLEGAQVELIQLPDSIKKSLYADEEGSFQFQNVSPSKYVLKISSLGYTTIKKRIEVTNEDLNLGTIKLQEKSETLEEVQIKGEIPPVTQMDDTTQYNAGSYKVNPDATAEDLVRKMPGVTMEGGEVKVQGEKVTRVLVDGKVFFGEDANTVLKNLPADMIDKVQVYDQGSEQAQFTGFDDGQTTKTINLITKPHMRNGKFGRVYGGYGTQDRYQAGGNINMFNGNRRLSLIGMSNNINVQNFSSQDLLGVAGGESGSRRGGRGNRFSAGSDARDFQIGAQNGITRTNAFGLNYMDKWGEKTEVVGSYFFNMTDNIENSFLNREYVFPSDSIQRYNERSMNTSQNINHRANLRINITLDTMTSLLILPSISLQQNSGLSNTSGQNRLNGLMLNETDNSLNTEFLGYNLANDVLFKRRFAKRGRTFSYNLHTGYNRNEGESFLYAENMFFRGLIDSDTIDQQSLLQQNGWNASGNAVYTEPIGKKSQVQLEHHISHQDNESDKRTFLFYPPEMGYTVLDTNLSNIFANTYTTN
ncbi:MAG: carboxypeptidase-like regulatory domain-containing protein, partial [Cytophagaceae bacterium]